MKNDSLVRCCVGGVFFDHQSNQWRIQDLNVIGQASYYKTLPDTFDISYMLTIVYPKSFFNKWREIVLCHLNVFYKH